MSNFLKKKTKITVVGSGYVGISLAILLAQHNKVIVYDIDPARVEKINNKKSTVVDADIESFYAEKELTLSATLDKHLAYKGADFVIVATPTNYDPNKHYFDTDSVDGVVADVLDLNSDAFIVIKSTIPVGHTKALQIKHGTERIIFSPEFLREGQALKDCLYPSRIIVGSKLEDGKKFANLLIDSASKKDIETLFMQSTEAEAVKLFANAYLAMRVSFFNELDSYTLENNLDTKSIINGICLDYRIGKMYNNPSFGYGGYCLPKDTKQLLATFDQVPQTLIRAIITSNDVRKDYISDYILKMNPRVVGIYRLVMKKDSDNFRESAIKDIMNRLKTEGIEIVIYEPACGEDSFSQSRVLKSLEEFKDISEIIISNRLSADLDDVKHKVFTRDLFQQN